MSRLVLRFAWVAVVGLMAVQPTSAAVDAATVQNAVKKAGEFLKKQTTEANFSQRKANSLGLAGLIGLTLIEAHVPVNDPAVQTAAKFVRTNAPRSTETYDVALSILFLDRLGQAQDYTLIQILGVRLYGGMNAAGGWGYKTSAGIPEEQQRQLQQVLISPPPPPGKLHPVAASMLATIRQSIATNGRQGLGAKDDNSNTQFALVALWVSTRYGLVVNDAFHLIETRFLQSQNRVDGGWYYSIDDPKSTISMTCAALLGLAAGASKREAVMTGKPDVTPLEKPPTKEGPNDPFNNPRKQQPGLPAAPKTDPEAEARKKAPGLNRAAVKIGLSVLGRMLKAVRPLGKPIPSDGGPFTAFVGAGNWYYMFWSIERVAVTYNLDTLGGVDWFDWGASFLLPSQAPDGSWDDIKQPEDFGKLTNTAFATLFLCKTNLLRDLRFQEKPQDPANSELRGTNTPPLMAPSQKPIDRPPSVELPPPPPPVETAELPPPVSTEEATKLAEKLVNAADMEWNDRLAEVRESRGVMNTLGLAQAINRLSGIRKRDAREALAQRLTRMTPATLRSLSRDVDPEIRRATVLAVAMRDDKPLLPVLIDRLTDPADIVVRAARAGLMSMTQKDFGPEPGAPEEDKVKAATEWQRWYATQPRQK